MKTIKKTMSALLSLTTIIGSLSIVPVSASAAEGVPYTERTWQDSAIVESTEMCSDYNSLSESAKQLETGWYVVDSDLTLSNRLNVANDQDVNLILCDGCTLKAPKGVTVCDTARLTVYGQSGDTGVLEAYNPDGAGIGGLDEKKAGTMLFKGGTINATGGGKDAGIGTGKNDDSKFRMIEIYGGTVNAKGGHMGAGIGAGRDNDTNSEVINIYGGTVNATGGKYGAGIGGGEDSAVHEINIYGGNVKATGGSEGAGIGSGNEEDNHGTINIFGGKITAKGGWLGAGIGGGDNGSSGKINFFDGDVTAFGGENAAGIGGGEDESADKITINGGNIKADAGDGAAIGGGEDGKEGKIVINGGTVKAKSYCGAGIGSGNCEDTDGSITINNGTVFASSFMGAGIGGGNHSMMESPITINGGDIYTKTGIDNKITSFDMMNKKGFMLIPSLPMYAGAGIGAGCWGSQDDKIIINGGIVRAFGCGSGLIGGDVVGSAGIGGGTEYRTSIITEAAGIKGTMTDIMDFFNPDIGDGGEGGPVEINGGIVIAWGGKDSSAIGYGQEGDELGELKINDDLSVYDIGIASDYHLSYGDIINTLTKLQDHSRKEIMQEIKEKLSSDLSIESLKEKIKIQEIAKGERSKACQAEEKLVVIMPKNINNPGELN